MILDLIKKEILLEWRTKYALNGIILYLASTVFIVYFTFEVSKGIISIETWNSLFWIIVIFTSLNAAAKSFISESAGSEFYQYQISSPTNIILSKMIHNGLLMIFLNASAIIIFQIVLNQSLPDPFSFILLLLAASISFSFAFTMISAISSKAGKNFVLMSILSFPVVIPTLLIVIRASVSITTIGDSSLILDELLILGAIDLILLSVSLLLFPYLWKS